MDGLLCQGRDAVTVDVEGHEHRLVAEEILHDLGVHPTRQQQGRGGVAQVGELLSLGSDAARKSNRSRARRVTSGRWLVLPVSRPAVSQGCR